MALDAEKNTNGLINQPNINVMFFVVSSQLHLRDKDRQLVQAFTDELVQIRAMFQIMQKYPPLHKNMPPVVGKLTWVHALKARIRVSIRATKTCRLWSVS